ncbi:MAG TPA: hypothetical protein DGR97_08275 [Gammaproteobacteria bacterium]|nr:hypothetical protein [Gammaproteobacteria bacterium]|tara:strand:- start:123 stop:317 length:195 start_codon:yes stop_codon:yes gene_type:complete
MYFNIYHDRIFTDLHNFANGSMREETPDMAEDMIGTIVKIRANTIWRALGIRNKFSKLLEEVTQ